uniref:Glutaredoxin n=1 Tax=Mesocestoides corti TaxID=53468 RepID=A0A5K3FK27_MESCO
MVQEFCKKIQVSSVPVVLFFLNNKVVGQVRGANAAELTKMIASLRGKQTASSDLNERIKALIHKAPIMLFMKGNPNEARCGFSRKMLEILRKNNIEFDFFDILSDDSIREGLKVYSDWPTYPQLYANGELIGGVDIVRQLAENNELRSALGL